MGSPQDRSRPAAAGTEGDTAGQNTPAGGTGQAPAGGSSGKDTPGGKNTLAAQGGTLAEQGDTVAEGAHSGGTLLVEGYSPAGGSQGEGDSLTAAGSGGPGGVEGAEGREWKPSPAQPEPALTADTHHTSIPFYPQPHRLIWRFWTFGRLKRQHGQPKSFLSGKLLDRPPL